MKTLINVKSKEVFIERKNAKDWPKEYSCNFIEAGIVSYEDVGQGVAFLKAETIQKMLPSFIGKPVLIDHHNVTPETFDKKAVGYVTKVWFDAASNWFHCSFIVTDDEAKKLIDKGYSVSCAFDVHDVAQGGQWHAIAYDEEITAGGFTHLALVSNPRYEGCKIYMNSKGMGSMSKENGLRIKILKISKGMFKAEVYEGSVLIDETDVCGSEDEALTKAQVIVKEEKKSQRDRKNKNAKACPSCESKNTKEIDGNEKHLCTDCGHKFNNKKENITMFGLKKKENKLDASKAFVIVDGQRVSIKELLNAKAEADAVELALTETIVDESGNEVAIADLVKTYENAKKKNADEDKDEEEKENEKMIEEQELKKTTAKNKKKKNESDEAEEKKKAAEKDDKENAEEDDEEKENEYDEEDEPKLKKKNSVEHFSRMSGKRENSGESSGFANETGPETMSTGIARGYEAFGPKK